MLSELLQYEYPYKKEAEDVEILIVCRFYHYIHKANNNNKNMIIKNGRS